jgi:chromosome segregation ATPase
VGRLLAAVLAAVFGFIVGRRTVGTSGDFAKLREDNDKLVDQIRQLESELGKLAELNRENETELERIGKQLREAEFLVEQSRRTLEGSGEDLDGLRKTNQRLADWISTYGTQVQNL